MKHHQAIVIGAGCAGLSAGIALKKNGIEDVLIIEKDKDIGGILNQCIHNGFGLTTFKEQLSGPQFAERFRNEALSLGVRIMTDTMVMKINRDKTVEYVNSKEGYQTVSADAIILSVGCYERNRGAIQIPGSRPAGIYTAGQAQRYLNLDGYMVGKKVFILGSGDIGLIMARRMTLEGAEVLGVAELMPYSNGLPRNIKQCLEDYGIPLYLSHTVTDIKGKQRLEKIVISEVDENRQPIKGSEKEFEVDTLLLSIGLIPENHLALDVGITMDPRISGPVVDESYMCDIEGFFACGNGLHVHDLADFAAHQGNLAGVAAARYIREGRCEGNVVNTIAEENVSYVVPARIHPAHLAKITEFYFRVRKPLHAGSIIISSGGNVIRTIHKEGFMPSEMETVVLSGEQLKSIKDDLVFEVREDV